METDAGAGKKAPPLGAADSAGWNRRVLRLAGPIILANMSVPLLGIVDTGVMGHLDQPYYIGAVAIGALLFSYIYWGFGFLRMSTTALTAQASGAGDDSEVRASLARALILALAIAAFVIVLQAPIRWLGLNLIDASPDVERLADTYFSIRIWGAPAALTNYVVLGWFLGRQNAKAALALQVFMNGLNIVLDLLFVMEFGWGVEGVAAATIIAEYAAAALGLFMIARALGRMGGTWSRASIADPARLRHLFGVNRDIFIRTLALVSAFAYFTSRGAVQGDTLLAANAVLLNFFMLLSFGLDGFAHAAEALVGSAFGARDAHALKRVVRTTTLWAFAVAGLFTLAYGGLGWLLIQALTDLPEVRDAARSFLPWIVALPLVSIWSFQLDGIFLGATHTRALRNAMLVSLAFFLVFVWVLMPLWGNHGLWLALLLFMVVRAVTLVVQYPAIPRSIR
ncbi:MAG: MATE family efflux transporter [Proteobacteria bacterium]|nr:MATE family efflux transporter [Pseudomonadota bacterium]